jgi:hypothetical protein
MLANARAFLFLAADLTVTRACRQRGLHVAAGVAGHAELQPSGRAYVAWRGSQWAPVPGRRHPPGITGLVFTGAPGNAGVNISRVYVFAVREICRAIQYCPVWLSYVQCGLVRFSPL